AAPSAAVNDWNIQQWTGQEESGPPGISFQDGAVVENAPEIGQLYGRPNALRYAFSDRHRERTNAQLTLQFRPVANPTLTTDFTYAENNLEEHRGEQTFWFANDNTARRVVFDDGIIATPLVYSENLTNKDMGFEQQYREQSNVLESIGFNADWQVNDTLSLRFDVHDSTMESLPAGPGNGGSI